MKRDKINKEIVAVNVNVENIDDITSQIMKIVENIQTAKALTNELAVRLSELKLEIKF